MKSCIVFGMPRAGNHLVLKLLDMMGMKGSWPTDKRGWPSVFDIPEEDYYGFAAHAPCTPEYVEMFRGCAAMGVYISRDLRDVATSRMLEDVKSHNKPATEAYVDGVVINIRNSWCECQREWPAQPRVYRTTYEKLVGSQGGGNDQTQMVEITAIHRHIGGQLSEERLREIAQGLYGPGKWPAYVRNAQIGAWKNHLTGEQATALQAQMAQEDRIS